ncbi:MAG: branched-chain amino acid ABC transporter permease [Candidatus Thorarchaeota archaeon]
MKLNTQDIKSKVTTGIQEIKETAKTPKGILLTVMFIVLGVFPLIVNHPLAIHVLILTFIYAFGGLAWNLLAGYTGQFSLGHSVFWAAGAYGITLYYTFVAPDIIIGLIFGIGFSIVLALGISLLSFRLRGVYFSMVTLASAAIMETLLGHYTHVEIDGLIYGGYYGFFLPKTLEKIHFYYIGFFLVISGLVLTLVIARSRLGKFMIAIREDEDLAKSLGINTYKVKTLTTIISAMLTAIVGGLFAIYIRAVSPIAFLEFTASWNIMVGPMIGGLGTILGPVFGTFLMYPITIALQGIFGGAFVGVPQIITGIGIFLIVMMMPSGVMDLIRKYTGSQNNGGKDGEQQEVTEEVKEDAAN